MADDLQSISFRISVVFFRFCRTGRPLTQAVLTCLLYVSIFGQDWKQVHDGVEYAHVEHELGNDPVKINLLRLDLTKVRLDVHHALDKAIGLETTSSIAKRKGAVAAINAGFFRLDKSEWAGDAAGILQIDRRLFSESDRDRIAICIINEPEKTQIEFGHVRTTLYLGLGVDTRYTISGINRERRENDLLLFTNDFGASTLTNQKGYEFVIRGSADFPRVGNAVSAGEGNSILSPREFIISTTGELGTSINSYFTRALKVARWGSLIGALDPKLTDLFRACEDITNGVPQLIKNGKIDITWEQEKASKAFVETRHPRTAVAKLKDAKFLMMTVDGRRPGVSVGMTLQELAEYLLSLGAVDAMNLDGGGSTTMFLDGKVVNAPSDKEGERKVGDAIVVTLRKPARL